MPEFTYRAEVIVHADDEAEAKRQAQAFTRALNATFDAIAARATVTRSPLVSRIIAVELMDARDPR